MYFHFRDGIKTVFELISNLKDKVQVQFRHNQVQHGSFVVADRLMNGHIEEIAGTVRGSAT
jgi:hypothetical protein